MSSRTLVSLPELFAETPSHVALEAELRGDLPPPIARARDGLEPPPVTVGSIIAERYEVEGTIGEGGMGRVFKVRHRQLGKRFALKLMHGNFHGDNRLRELFYREARLASSLSHPNIVSIVDFGEDADLRPYMVMELVEGEPLHKRMQQGFLTLKQTFDIMLGVAEALHYVHQRDIVHCDLKPENILIVEEKGEGRRKTAIKLLDFGLARLSTGRMSATRLEGTPDYMAPEKIVGGQPRPSMDVYGLGCLGYALLAGRTPFSGSIEEVLEGHVQRMPPLPSVVRGEQIDERAEALVMKALAKDPADRQKDMSAMLYEIRTLMDMLGWGRKRAPFVKVTTTTAAEGRAVTAATVFDLSPVPLAAVDIDGNIVIANKSFAQFVTGSAEAGMAGQDLMATRLVEICPDLPGNMRKVHITGEPLERRFRLRTGDGGVIRMVMQMVPGAPGKGDVHLAIFAADRVEE